MRLEGRDIVCVGTADWQTQLPINQHQLMGRLAARTTGIAYETVQLADGSLPLLAPMSEVAGRMATQIGAHYLESHNGGRGVLLAFQVFYGALSANGKTIRYRKDGTDRTAPLAS